MSNLSHEDERRKLFSYPEAKVLEVKKDCVLGRHFHKLKTELFILSTGECKITRNHITEVMELGKIYEVKPNEVHEFEIKEGSILVGLNSKSFDPSDDYKVTPH